MPGTIQVLHQKFEKVTKTSQNVPKTVDYHKYQLAVGAEQAPERELILRDRIQQKWRVISLKWFLNIVLMETGIKSALEYIFDLETKMDV